MLLPSFVATPRIAAPDDTLNPDPIGVSEYVPVVVFRIPATRAEVVPEATLDVPAMAS